MRKKASWLTLPLRIWLYKIFTLKDTDVEAEDLKKFGFGTKSFNPYDPHYICNNHYVKVYYPWIHEACHWKEEDPWRYCYNSYRLNELVSVVVEWKASLHVATP